MLSPRTLPIPRRRRSMALHYRGGSSHLQQRAKLANVSQSFQVEDSVDEARSSFRATNSPLIDVGPGNFKSLAEAIHKVFRISLGIKCRRKIIRAEEDIFDAGGSSCNQQWGRDPVAGGESSESERLLKVLPVALPSPDWPRGPSADRG